MFVSDCLDVNAQGHLTIGGLDTVELAKEFGTPVYIMDENQIRQHCRDFVESMNETYSGHGHVLYASKAFSCKEMCRICKEEGMGLDVVSGGELYTALQAGFPADRIYMHGNNKTVEELQMALDAGISRIIVDNLTELHTLNDLAAHTGKKADIMFRIKPGIDAHTHSFIRTGQIDSKFGLALETGEALEGVREALKMERIHLCGLHCHIGSQIFALHSFREAAAVMVEFMARIRDTYGHEITELDLGGGLGIAYLAEHQPSSIDDFAEVTCSAVRDLCALHNLPLPRLLVEPGRSLVAPAGVTLYTVGILKTLPGIRKYVAIDGGMSDNIRTALYHADYEPTIANKAGQPREEIVTLCGKHCESGDAVVIDMPLQKADLGDIVCVFGTGAYNMTMASNYNGQPRPAVVFVRDGASRVVTRRETYEDLYQRDL